MWQLCWCLCRMKIVKNTGVLLDPLVLELCGCDFKFVILKLISGLEMSIISHGVVIVWMPQDPADEQSTLVWVMVGAVWQWDITWSHYLKCCWQQVCMLSLGHNELTDTKWQSKAFELAAAQIKLQRALCYLICDKHNMINEAGTCAPILEIYWRNYLTQVIVSLRRSAHSDNALIFSNFITSVS